LLARGRTRPRGVVRGAPHSAKCILKPLLYDVVGFAGGGVDMRKWMAGCALRGTARTGSPRVPGINVPTSTRLECFQNFICGAAQRIKRACYGFWGCHVSHGRSPAQNVCDARDTAPTATHRFVQSIERTFIRGDWAPSYVGEATMVMGAIFKK
jgi:hypothetical protein